MPGIPVLTGQAGVKVLSLLLKCTETILSCARSPTHTAINWLCMSVHVLSDVYKTEYIVNLLFVNRIVKRIYVYFV